MSLEAVCSRIVFPCGKVGRNRYGKQQDATAAIIYQFRVWLVSLTPIVAYCVLAQLPVLMPGLCEARISSSSLTLEYHRRNGPAPPPQASGSNTTNCADDGSTHVIVCPAIVDAPINLLPSHGSCV